jgi:hypothetical protein
MQLLSEVLDVGIFHDISLLYPVQTTYLYIFLFSTADIFYFRFKSNHCKAPYHWVLSPAVQPCGDKVHERVTIILFW